MYKTQSFKKKLLVTAIASTSLTGFSGVALAQDAIEEVVVTGIRASLEASMDTKRNSSGVVDAISAEDIGKFPDSNLAESLQRITGVSIDRQNGEGFQVTVRGFGPTYNLVTLNGRTMPASQLGQVGGLVNNRAFDMSNIASEGVSGVQVYKTGKANISSGGIGATVNLTTTRPLDSPGFKATIGAKALHDTTNRIGDDVTPEVSGLVSWTDDSEVFGASLSFSHQRRDSAQTGAFINNWSDYSGPYTDATFFEGINEDNVDTVNVTNAPPVGTQTNSANGVRYIHADYERERTNGQLTLQFRPMENLTATLDYTLAEQESFYNRAELSLWFGGGTFPAADVQFDDNQSVATPIYFWIENPAGIPRDINYAPQQSHVQTNLESLGLNVKWDISDQFSLTLDAHDSSSESLPGDGAVGNFFSTGVGAVGGYGHGYVNTGDLMLLVNSWDDDFDPTGTITGTVRDGGLVPNELDKGDLGSTVRQINYDRTWSDITQVRVDGRFEFDNDAAIDFGVDFRSMENVSKSSFDQTLLEGGWGVANPGDIPGDMVEELDFGSLFDGYATSLDSDAQAFFDAASGGTAEVMLNGYIGDADKLGEYLSEANGLAWAPNPDDNVNRTIKEDIFAIYSQIDVQGELGNMPVDVLAGIRYERTEIESNSQVASAAVVWQGDNDFTVETGNVATAPVVVGEADYSHVLPSLDIAVHVTDDVITRFSWGKSIARANYNDITEGIGNIGGPAGGPTILGGNPGGARNGNVGLKPIESDNLDISVEWYYNESSYASIGFFDKRVPNFIGTAQILTTLEETRDPTNGPRAEAAIAELEARNIPVTQQSLFQMVASMSTPGEGCRNAPDVNLCGADYDSEPYEAWENGVDIVALPNDPLSVNLVQTPVNSQDARLYGWEFAVQHFFGDTGFGLQANYTGVNGSVAFDVEADPSVTQFALTGLSDSANLTAIYDKDGLQARIAYNWRDGFLDNPAVSVNEPQFTEDYSQVDISIGYDITDNFTVTLEGINVLEEDKRQHGRSQRQLTRLEILGARYALSARYTF
jgi:TonB-dependent receptor